MSSWQQLSPSTYHRLPMGTAFGISDIGTVRSSNQDNLLIAPALGLLAVADGMGGHHGGEVASAEALRLLAEHLAAHRLQGDPDATWTGPAAAARDLLRHALLEVNAKLYAANNAAGQPDGMGMGTTLTGLWQPAPASPLLAFHIGDSRLYRYRDGQLAQLTRDQTMYQQALDMGAAEPLPPKNLLLQAVGPSPGVQPDVQAYTALPGDLYLLCTDGLHGPCSAGAISAALSVGQADSLHAVCASLVEMARHDGSRDNITALLLHIAA